MPIILVVNFGVPYPYSNLKDQRSTLIYTEENTSSENSVGSNPRLHNRNYLIFIIFISHNVCLVFESNKEHLS